MSAPRTSDPIWSDSRHWNFTSRSMRQLFADRSGVRKVRVEGDGTITARAVKR